VRVDCAFSYIISSCSKFKAPDFTKVNEQISFSKYLRLVQVFELLDRGERGAFSEIKRFSYNLNCTANKWNDYQSFLFIYLFIFSFILSCKHPFCLKLLYNIYYMTSRASLPEYLPLANRKALECYVTLRLRHSRASLSPHGKYSGISHSKSCNICIMALFVRVRRPASVGVCPSYNS
jgi:hypothetical protein